MEISLHPRPTRGMPINDFGGRRGGGPSRNKQWVAGSGEGPSRSASSTPGHSDTDIRDRGRGRGYGHPPRVNGTHPTAFVRKSAPATPTPEATLTPPPDDPVLETQEEREKFYQELVKQREVERKTAIAQGKMDDPLVAKRLEDAISIVGTCMDMCPRFERYRRERENNLFEWETSPGTKRVDHKRAVKMYERAAGDKTLPSDLRPPLVLKRTLDYLFHDLLPRGGFSPTFNFIRDRSRSVRNDFTMQHNTGELAIECHERCARFHILALYLERDREGFSIALEEQQLMNTLQSLKEFYNDQRATYESPAELEMRIYHRLVHIRDQVERPEPVPLSSRVAEHPMYKLTTAFRAHVQEKSKPITKTSRLRVDAEGMRIFGELAAEMMGEGGGGKGMVFLVACILERLFGKGTVNGIDDIRGGASWGDIIDGVTGTGPAAAEAKPLVEEAEVDELDDEMTEQEEDIDIGAEDELLDEDQDMRSPAVPSPLKPTASGWLAENFGPNPAAPVFGPPSAAPVASAFSNLGAVVPGKSVFGATSAFARKSVFGHSGASPFGPIPNTVAANGSAPNGSAFAPSPNPFRTPVESPQQPEASTSSPPANTPSSDGFAVPPRVQNNPFLPASNAAQTTSPFGPPSSIPPVPSVNNIFAPTPAKPAKIDFTEKGKGKADESFSWGSTAPSTSALNPQGPAFAPRPSLFQPQLQATKPVFGVTPIPDFSGFSAPSSSAPSSPSAFNTPLLTLKPASKHTPPLAKIDTSPATDTDGAYGPASPLTPGNPPPLAKVQPISLPSTPTASAGPAFPSAFNVGASPSSSAPPAQPRPNKAGNPLLGFLKNSLQTSGLGGGAPGGSGSGMLSPLVLASPSSTPLRNSFSPVKPQAVDAGAAVSPTPIDRKGKGKERAEDPVPDRDLDAVALAFEQHGLAVKTCFATWQRRTTDRAEWAEACRQSEKYSQKVRRAREMDKGGLKRTSTNGWEAENGNKRMRMLENGADESELDSVMSTCTAKRRTSVRRKKYEAPRTDEDLAKRFQENKEEYTRRWAQGSFLQIIRSLVKSKSARLPSSALWRIWLSLNPESDPTAIWLECKFNVPGSGGQWESETVFSIPVVATPPRNPAAHPTGYPGVIVFECTPLEGVEDDLERKYRVLDDCSRLRDIVKTLPVKRHFVPSLLLFVWARDEPSSDSDASHLPADFLDMVNKLVADSILTDFRVFCVTSATTDLDRKFDEAMGALQLDIEGGLVQSLTLRDVFKLFDPAFNSFISEWTKNCSSMGYFDWALYSRLLDVAIALLNKTALLSLSLVEADPDEHVLPDFRPDGSDSESTFTAVMSWLADAKLDRLAASIVETDLQSHREMGRDFPSVAFIDHLRGLALYQAEPHVDKMQTFFVASKDIAPSVEQYNTATQSHQSALGQTLRLSIRRSPRRRSRSLSEDTEQTSSTYSKRRRLSSSFEKSDLPSPSSSPPHANGRTTLSPSNSTVSLAQTDSSSAPRVTIAMLRALTRDVKSKYGKS
ncbi:hypothetical protein B0H10DRAFT_2058094 [Mycena sp. CBHHK59/15]|nr:hypothetical protein B0H10DRAFT_2058094 [Mycena sp. CBHHK59/15]